MHFTHPALLATLAALPLLWWLLRASPPPPRLQDFPAIRLLADLQAAEETPQRTPLWVLALRLAACALLIVGLAGPMLGQHAGAAARTGAGTMLLVVDDGWASAHDWEQRRAAANAIIAQAEAAGQRVVLLATAREADASAPALSPAEPAAIAAARIAALRPLPWSVDRAGAAHALVGAPAGAFDVVLLSDGVATADDAGFAAALHRVAAGRVTELRDSLPARLLLAPRNGADAMTVRLAQPGGVAHAATALAIDDRGGTLARFTLEPAGDGVALGRIALPLELRNTLARITVSGLPTAASTRLLDESDRRRPVGLVAGDPGAETPLTGSLFYVERALAGEAELRHGTIAALLARPLSVLVLTDRTVTDPASVDALRAWVERGGTLVRFAGPRLAASTDTGADPLLPVELMQGTRALGGAMSWSRPQHLLPFPAGSPFAGLAVPGDVTVTRQVLARPSLDLASRTWVTLADGTPLVTARRLGQGRIVLFHVTANAEWSDLPLSGLFVQMLDRVVRLAAGIASPGDATMLAPVAALDANGALGSPGPAAAGLAADRFGAVAASPRHPPGLYGASGERRSLNVADALPALAPEAAIGTVETLERHAASVAAGPVLLGLAVALLGADVLVALMLRGLLAAPAMLGLAVLAMLASAPAQAVDAVPQAALQTELAYVVTGDPAVDRISQEGLAALSDYVNARTAATLGEPAGVRPGVDDLAFFPLIYWPILAGATPDPKLTAALDAYTRSGGIVLIDTEGSDADATDAGSGAGFAPGAAAALRRVSVGLDVPPLAKLSSGHVLAHSFYLLHDFPGRFVGAPVWVEQGADPSNDGVSPVIIGANAWAAAWAMGPDGQPALSVIPGGETQRTMAYRFGVNLVMYALTGNYKADQVHIPALLQRLGRSGAGDADDEPALGK